jgi:hypothetical protein
MNENKSNHLSSISQASTIEEIAEYWDEHSLADEWDKTEEVTFDVRAERRRRVTLAPELYEQIEIQARFTGLLPETLVNLWLAERLAREKAA